MYVLVRDDDVGAQVDGWCSTLEGFLKFDIGKVGGFWVSITIMKKRIFVGF